MARLGVTCMCGDRKGQPRCDGIAWWDVDVDVDVDMHVAWCGNGVVAR